MSEIHDQIRSLLAAYVMDAVPQEEIPAIRAHILSCEECFEEADAFAASLAVLAESADPVPLPEGFTDRVLAAARGDIAASGEVRPARAPWWSKLVLRTAVALMAVALAFTSISWIRSTNRQHRYENAVAALVDDGGRISLSGPGGAMAVVASKGQTTTLVAINLGEAPDGRDYQLWLMKDGVPTPSETFDVSGSVVIVESNIDLTGFDGAAITVEPDGGSTQPTTEPVLSG